MSFTFELNGVEVAVDDASGSLLEVLRERLGVRSPKDGCSPQGQCGCCTVLVDGAPRVACVTPARRVAGRSVTTVEGLDEATRQAWGDAFCATGGSQCGFCTPGIVLRLEGLRRKGIEPGTAGVTAEVEQALAAHLCRCTGWATVVEAFAAVGAGQAEDRDLDAAARRAALEGGAPQAVGPEVALGAGGFAADTAPADALVAVPDGAGGWAVGDTLAAARSAAGKVQGRHTTAALHHPVDVPPGDWAVTLQTTWVEPAYLETDASWCAPGGEPASALANGGAFGGKRSSAVGDVARRMADEHGRPVLVALSREDVVRAGPKRPPLAAGIRADGTGIVRVARTPGAADTIRAYAPSLEVEEVDVVGPPTSLDLRGAGWAEAAVLLAAVGGDGDRVEVLTGATAPAALARTVDDDAVAVDAVGEAVRVVAPGGGSAVAWVADGRVGVRVAAGEPLDEVVLRSYAIGAAHQALGWVTSEGITVDEDGQPRDLTIRSFGVLKAADTPPVDVTIERPAPGQPAAPVNGSDAVFAAVAAAVWRAQGTPPAWPTGVPVRPR